jgi:8-oxo-dGTP pyrophosphatase MutT (NUDIX family)
VKNFININVMLYVMRQFDSRTFTQKEMELMCDTVGLNSFLFLHSGGYNHERKYLDKLMEEGYIPKGSTLQQGIKSIRYSGDEVVIMETPLQYPSQRLVAEIDKGKKPTHLVGPMTGVFAHVFQDDAYVAQVRGRGIEAPGEIQIVAGMGEYGLYPADKALKEVSEEAGVREPQLVLDRDKFLDVTPFMKSGRFPQPIFSYIVTGDLGHITEYVRNNAELERFVASLEGREPKEAYPFVVPIEFLRDFLHEVDGLGKFYGPVKRTADNFLDWYNRKFEKSY